MKWIAGILILMQVVTGCSLLIPPVVYLENCSNKTVACSFSGSSPQALDIASGEQVLVLVEPGPVTITVTCRETGRSDQYTRTFFWLETVSVQYHVHGLDYIE
jgi:hypothetical protein